MARIIKVDGTEETVEVPPADGDRLSFLQKAVGGYIEMVRLRDRKTVMLVNEEGLIHRLPLNPMASVLAGKAIVGDAVIVRVPQEFD